MIFACVFEHLQDGLCPLGSSEIHFDEPTTIIRAILTHLTHLLWCLVFKFQVVLQGWAARQLVQQLRTAA